MENKRKRQESIDRLGLKRVGNTGFGRFSRFSLQIHLPYSSTLLCDSRRLTFINFIHQSLLLSIFRLGLAIANYQREIRSQEVKKVFLSMNPPHFRLAVVIICLFKVTVLVEWPSITSTGHSGLQEILPLYAPSSLMVIILDDSTVVASLRVFHHLLVSLHPLHTLVSSLFIKHYSITFFKCAINFQPGLSLIWVVGNGRNFKAIVLGCDKLLRRVLGRGFQSFYTIL